MHVQAGTYSRTAVTGSPEPPGSADVAARPAESGSAVLDAPLRVILNDRVLFRPLTGVGNYVRQLLRALCDEAGTVRVRPFLSAILPVRHLPLRYRRETAWWLRRALQRTYAGLFRWQAHGHQVYHEPNHIPIVCDVPTVTTVHDLSVLVHPEWHPDDRVRWYEREFEAGRRHTCRFIVASEFTKREMSERLGIAPDRMDVTYQAPRPGLRPQSPPEVARVRAQHKLPDSFFLYVGTLEPRKNVPGLLEAYGALPKAIRRRHPLVVTGGTGWKMEAIARHLAWRDLQEDTRLLGYVRDDALASLYTAGTAFVWPSFYEGFGLPPLEAMTCGCPVIVSDAASLPEVVGDGGILLNPNDTASWTEAMRRMAEDADWREHWRQRGFAQTRRFSWQRCARQTIACYQAALRSAH